MHFGQFNLMGYRTPGAKAHELYDNAVEQVKAAEANGFEIAWFAEHHFSNSMVDALTHGRLVLGVGSGYQPYEFERFGEALDDSVLELAFTRDTFSYDGTSTSICRRRTSPRAP